MAMRIIESVEQNPAPLHIMLGSQALAQTIEALSIRLENYKHQKELAKSMDVSEIE